ncbi:E2F-associated phosphoprotein [Wolffia australiana]
MAADPKTVGSGKDEGVSNGVHGEEMDVVEEVDVAGPASAAEQEIESSDEEIDYSTRPEFYDSDLDDKDAMWVQKRRKGRTSDAILTCPACFTTLCLDCQRHEKYVTQYRAMFVLNCAVKQNEILRQGTLKSRRPTAGVTVVKNSDADDVFRPVCCVVCSTEVGVLDSDQVYHFFNVLPSFS